MPDNLTQIFKEELSKRGVVATDLEIENFLKNQSDLPTTGAAQSAFRDQESVSLWETAQTDEPQDWWTEALGDVGGSSDFNLISALGKGVWAGLEVATLGATGLAARKFAPGVTEWAQPKNFAERVTVGLGGVAGFMPPFSIARGVVGTALKGAKPVAGMFARKGTSVAYGATKASEQFTKNSVKILMEDKQFISWATKQGIGRKELPGWIVKSGILEAPRSKIASLGLKEGRKIMSNHTLRAQYKKNIDDNIGKVIRSRIEKEATIRPGFKISGSSVKLIEDEVKNYVGGKYNFPITRLSEYLAAKWGNSKMASIGAAAAEEAILFTAVEIPLNFVNSIYNEDPEMDFNLFGTIGHATLLGSALGGIRLIPGGMDMGILRPALARMSKMMSKRSRYASYDVKDAKQRIDLVTHAKSIWGQRKEMTKSLRVKNIPEGNRALVTTEKDLESFAKSAASATELKNWLISIETAFNKEWWPQFISDAGKDLWGSSVRMLAGSAAFNVGLWKQYIKGEVPTEDLVFHTALGAVLSKRGHTVEYKDHKGEWQSINNDRPYIYTDKFQKVNEYLNVLGVNPDNAAFSNLLNNLEIMNKYGAPDYSHKDINSITEIATKHKLVTNLDAEPKSKSSLKKHELYDTIRMIVEASPEAEGKRYKDVSELTPKQLESFLKDLRETEFETLSNYRTTKAGQGTEKGIVNWADVMNIVAQSNGVKTEKAVEVYLDAIKNVWDEMYLIEDKTTKKFVETEEGTGRLILREVAFDHDVPFGPELSRVTELFGNGRLESPDGEGKNTNSALGLVRNRVKMIKGNPIKLTREMIDTIFGDSRSDMGLLGKFDKRINEHMYGEDNNPGDFRIGIGHAAINDPLNTNLFMKSVVNTRNSLAGVRDVDPKMSRFGDKEATQVVHDLMTKMFGNIKKNRAGFLSDIVEVKNGKTILDADSVESRFATSVLDVLRADISRNTQRTDSLGSKLELIKTVNISEVKILMDFFDKAGIKEGFTGNKADVEVFTDHLKNYSRRIELANAKRRDGTPLTGEDLATFAVLAESKLMGSNFSLADVEAVLGDVKAALRRTDITNKELLSEVVKMDPGKFKSLLGANMALWRKFEKAAMNIKGSGSEIDKSVQQLLGNFLEIYTNSIEHLIVGPNGVGTLKFGGGKAAVTPDYLFGVIQAIDTIKKGHLEITHNRLLDAIDTIYQGSQYKTFLEAVQNSFVGRKSNVPRIYEALKYFKLFNPKRDKFFFDEIEGELPLRDRIKLASNRIRLLTNPIATDKDLAMLMERDKQDYSPMYHSDLQSSMSLEKLRSKWGLSFSAPEFIPGKTLADMLQESISKDYKEGFNLDNFFDHITKDMEYEKNGVVYTEKDWRKLDKSTQLALVADTIKVWNGFDEGINTRTLKAGENAIPISDPAHARKSHLTDYLSELFGDVIFADENFRQANGISVNIKSASSDTFTKYLESFVNPAVKAEASKSRSEGEPGRSADSLTENQGHIIAFLGDMDSGIGIPLRTRGGALGQDTLAADFVQRMISAKQRFKDHPAIVDKIDELMSLYVRDNKTRIVSKEIGADDFVVYKVVEGVNMYEHKTLKSKDGDARDIWIVDSKEAAQRQLLEMQEKAISRGENFFFADELVEIKKDGKAIGWKLEDNKIIHGEKRGDHKYIYEEINAPKDIKIDKERQSGMEYIKSGESKYKMRYPRADIKGSEDATVMLTIAFGDRVMGKNFWDALVNSKGESKGWSRQKQLAHDVLRRTRLFSNRTTTRMSRERAKQIYDFYNKNKIDVPHFKSQKTLETLAETGHFNFHVIRDESAIKGEANPIVSSIFKDFTNQVMEERNLSESWLKSNGTDIVGLDKADQFSGGLGDSSKFNSIVYVTKDFIDSLKMMYGENVDLQHHVVAGKPVIAFADEGTGAFLGKTMFAVDSRFEPYMENNNINALVFSSAVKLQGSDYDSRVIDMKSFKTLDEFLISKPRSAEDGPMDIVLPIESIEMQSWVATDHAAKIPMHVGTDLVGEGLNKSYAKWLMNKPLRSYEDGLSKIVGSNDINQMIASADGILGSLGENVDNATYSSMRRWLDAGGYPMFLPFRNSMNNTLFRHYVDQAGVFSPSNNMGSQSALIPDTFGWNHEHGLRNTTFYDENNPRIFTYGQIEVGTNNMSKAVEKDSLQVVFHREGRPDELLLWKDFIKILQKDVRQAERYDTSRISEDGKLIIAKLKKGRPQDLLFGKKRGETLDSVHNYLLEINKGFKKGESAEVLLTVTRTPSTRESDKVLVGLKGFVDGNLARLNSVDAWTRLEADHDYDKVNYWWDTPPDIVKHWDKGSGKILSITPDRDPLSIEDLDIREKKSLVDYNFNNQHASKYRGIAMKARRTLQFMKHYQGFESKSKLVKGYNLGWSEGGMQHRIRIDQDRLDLIERDITKDIQGIVDSKDGFDKDYYNEKWFIDKIAGSDEIDGIFVYEKREGTGEWVAESGLQKIHKDIIDISLQPYKNLLQLSTDQYVEGEAKSVDYQSFISGYDSYRDAMSSLPRYAVKGLKKKGYKPEDYGGIFFLDRTGTKFRDIFGLRDAKMPAPLRKGMKADYSRSDVLLPFDKGVWSIASLDRLSLDAPGHLFTKTERDFDKIWEAHVDKDLMEDAVIGEIRRSVKKDIQKIEYLNVVDRRLRRARNGLRNAKRYRDESLQDFLGDRVNRLKNIREKVNDEVLSDPSTRKVIAKNIINQIVTRLHNGKEVYLADVDKKTGKIQYTSDGRLRGQTKVSLLKELGYKKFKSKKARENWVNNNWIRINASIWTKDKGKLALNVKGISSNEYAQIVMWHRTLASKMSFMLDPRLHPFAHEFENAVHEFKKSVGEDWSKFKTGREFGPNEREGVVSDVIMRRLESEFRKWEDEKTGLGQLFVLKLMAPTPSSRSVTYHKGNWLAGFDNVSRQIKFIGLGLRFISSTEQIWEMPGQVRAKIKRKLGRDTDAKIDRKQAIYDDLAKTFTNLMRVMYGKMDVPKETAHLFEGLVDAPGKKTVISESIGSLTLNESIKEASELFRTLDKGDVDEIAKISPHVRSHYGVTGEISLDYMSLKGAPLGLDRLFDIRKMAEFYFKPSKVINSQGYTRNISDLSSYYGFVKNNAKVYFGETSDRNLIHSELPHRDVSDYHGGEMNSQRIRTAEDKNSEFDTIHTNAGFRC